MTDYPSFELVWKAADRILKMGYPNNLTQEERLEKFNEDAAFCAAFIEDIWAKERLVQAQHPATGANDLRR